jgi:lysophospholipase L1-like esterase
MLTSVWLTGCAAPKPLIATPASNPLPITLFLVGDSTMSDKPLIPAGPERGWGQLLPMYFKDQLHIANFARNGRSSKSFLAEGRWATVREQLKPGDYVLIQFGHNDEKKDDPLRYTEPFADFKHNLALYIRETRERKALPMLATPVVRRSFTADGKLRDTHGDYAVAIRQVASEEHVPLIDLEKRSAALVSEMGPEQSKRLFDWVQPGEFKKHPAGLSDDTHFCAYGASRMCDLATDEMKMAVPELARWLRK